MAEACLGTISKNTSKQHPAVYPKSVRVAKILGGNVSQSHIVHGMVILRGAEVALTSVDDSKVTFFGCGIKASATEAKGNMLMENSDNLKGYNKSEEKKMEEVIKIIAETGTKLIVSGGTIAV